MRLRGVAGLGRFLGLAERHGFLLLKIGEPRVLLLRQQQACRRGFQPGLCLFDAVIDLHIGERQTALGSGFIRLRRGKGSAGDLDLKRDFQPQPGQCGLLPFEFGFGCIDLASSQIHLVAVGLRVDFHQQLILLDAIVLLDKEGDEMPRHRLRRHVDDMRLNKGVLRD